MAAIRLAEIASWIQAELRGNGDLLIEGADALESAQANQLTFVDHRDAAPRWNRSKASAAIVPSDWPAEDRPTLAVPQNAVREAFAAVAARFRPPVSTTHGMHGLADAAKFPLAQVAPSAVLMPDIYLGCHVTIGERCVIHSGVRILDGGRIGDDTVIFPNAVLYEGTVVGRRCIIHANAVLGAYGFGYRTQQGKHHLLSQLGYVEIADEVEIGAGTTIDRGAYGPTRIGEGSKLDNLVQIGHNCQIGKANLICAQVGIAGSTVTGEYVTAGGQVGVRDHTRIGDKAVLTACAAVSADVDDSAVMLGVPAFPYRQATLQLAAIAKLPEMRKEFKDLVRRVEALQRQIAAIESRDAA